jgi:23S rRNA pseudouridine2604 synthase
MTDLKRLNKYISETGICSRREADTLIEMGKVVVNGDVAPMGLKVSDSDTITVNGRTLKAKPKRVYIAYNKPVGVTCTTEKKIQSNIVSAINYQDRIFPIGRLDRPSEGLIFLTNEGDIVNKILRAGNNHEKEYIVTVDKEINSQFIRKMASGIPILDTVTKKCKVTQLTKNRFNIVLTQGLNRQIRRMCEYLGYEVTQLKRVRIMNVSIGNLARGQWRFLTQSEMDEINRSIEQSSKTQERSEDPNKQPSFKHKSKAGAAHHAKGYNRDGKSLPTNKPKSPSKKRLTGTLKFKK